MRLRTFGGIAWAFESTERHGSYMKRCQVTNNLFFNGSTGDPLAEQLKSLYLFSRFAYENQGKSPEDFNGPFGNLLPVASRTIWTVLPG